MSLTSGEPPPETKALLDEDGRRGAAAARRRRGVPGDRRGRALGGAPRGAGASGGPWRPGWPALAARPDVVRRRPAPRRGRPRRPPVALSERESLGLPGGRRASPVTEADRRRRRRRPPSPPRAGSAGRSRSSSTPSGSPTRPTLGGVALGLRGDDAVYGAAADAARDRRGATASTVRGLLVEPMADAGRRADRRPAPRPAVRAGRAGRPRRRPDRGPRRRRDPARARSTPATADAMLDDLRGARLLRRRPRPARRSIGRPSSPMLVALGRLGDRAARHPRGRPQPGHRVGRRRDRGRRAGRAGGTRAMTEPDEPVLLDAGDAVGRPADAQPAGQAQRPDQRELRRRARRRDRRGRSPTPRVRVIVIEGAGRAFCVGLRPDRGGRGRDRRPGRLARAPRRRRRGDARDPRLPEAGHRPGPRLRAGRRPRAGDGLRPDRRGRGDASSASPRSATGRRRSRC